MVPPVAAQKKSPALAVLGLGSMGLGMAKTLMKAGFSVSGYDVSATSMQAFARAGGQGAASAAQAVAGADIVVCVVVNGAQTEKLLFGPAQSPELSVAQAMPEGAVFVACATMDPQVARALGTRLAASGRLYLDAPISGGAQRAAEGALTILASGAGCPGSVCGGASGARCAGGKALYAGRCAGAGGGLQDDQPVAGGGAYCGGQRGDGLCRAAGA